MENDGWVDSFTEYGRVDLISASYPFRANTNGGFLLVNGTPTVINTESLTLSASDKRRSDYRRLIKRRPSVSPIMKLQFDHHEQLSGGGQRFVFTDYFSECRACELAATGYFAFDFDQEGCFIGTQMLRITLPLDPTKSR
jgi:hypothetical protein